MPDPAHHRAPPPRPAAALALDQLRRKQWRDLILMVLALLLIYGLGRAFDASEWLIEWAERHESWELDELLLTLIGAPPLFALFAWQRWQEARVQLRIALTDELSGLANRRHAELVLQAELSRSQRYARPLAIIMIDIDHFKRINDQGGHAQGDRVLRELPQLLTRDARTTDLVARWGGEEFMLICPETDVQQAALIAERLRLRVAEWGRHQSPADITASFGVAGADGPGPLSLTELIERADLALYRAKHEGRNRCHTADATHPRASAKPG
jgi:diguanylate cyclase (GGDEF)-like protein